MKILTNITDKNTVTCLFTVAYIAIPSKYFMSYLIPQKSV